MSGLTIKKCKKCTMPTFILATGKKSQGYKVGLCSLTDVCLLVREGHHGKCRGHCFWSLNCVCQYILASAASVETVLFLNLPHVSLPAYGSASCCMVTAMTITIILKRKHLFSLTPPSRTQAGLFGLGFASVRGFTHAGCRTWQWSLHLLVRETQTGLFELYLQTDSGFRQAAVTVWAVNVPCASFKNKTCLY